MLWKKVKAIQIRAWGEASMSTTIITITITSQILRPRLRPP
jgi:hypothetical protein